MLSNRTRRLAGIALALYGAVAAVIVFTPVSYAQLVQAIARSISRATGWDFYGSGWIEFVANIALFVPLGLLLALVLRRAWLGALVAVIISITVELAQSIIPNREPAVRDVISNAIGAAIGAFLAWLIVLRRRRTSRPPGRV